MLSVAQRAPPRALGLLEVGFGYALASLYVANLNSLDLISKSLLDGFAGALLSSILVILDPVSVLLFLIFTLVIRGSVESQYRYLARAFQRQSPRGSPKEEMGEFRAPRIRGILDSPLLAASKAKITAAAYLIFTLLSALGSGVLNSYVPNFFYIGGILLFLLIVKVSLDIVSFGSKLVAVGAYVVSIYSGAKLDEVERMRNALERQDWPEANAWTRRILEAYHQ